MDLSVYARTKCMRGLTTRVIKLNVHWKFIFFFVSLADANIAVILSKNIILHNICTSYSSLKKETHICHVRYFLNVYHKYNIFSFSHIHTYTHTPTHRAFSLSFCWYPMCNISACDSRKSLFFMQICTALHMHLYVNRNNTKVYTVKMSIAF